MQGVSTETVSETGPDGLQSAVYLTDSLKN